MKNMENQDSISRASTPFQRYVFHWLPGLPVMVGICIILWELGLNDNKISEIIHKLQLPSSEGLLGFTFFLVILILALSFVFLFGMIVDSIRHMVEETFLVPKWSEYKIMRSARRTKSPGDKSADKMEDSGRKWDLYDKVHETEYYYIEFFGNVAISLAFLWGVITWEYPKYFSFESKKEFYFVLYILWMHVVFLARPYFAPAIWEFQKLAIEKQPLLKEKKKEKIEKDIKEDVEKVAYDLYEKSERIEGRDLENWLKAKRIVMTHWQLFKKGCSYAWLNVLYYRMYDFIVTIASIILLLILAISKVLCTQAFHFYFIGVIMITVSFELYIVRFKRYQEILKALFLSSEEKATR